MLTFVVWPARNGYATDRAKQQVFLRLSPAGRSAPNAWSPNHESKPVGAAAT